MFILEAFWGTKLELALFEFLYSINHILGLIELYILNKGENDISAGDNWFELF